MARRRSANWPRSPATLARTGIDAAPEAYARLNALVAALYQLTREQYGHVVASFPLLPPARCAIVLRRRVPR